MSENPVANGIAMKNVTKAKKIRHDDATCSISCTCLQIRLLDFKYISQETFYIAVLTLDLHSKDKSNASYASEEFLTRASSVT